MSSAVTATKLHPLIATAAVAVTGVSVLAAVMLVRNDVAARHLPAVERQVVDVAQADSAPAQTTTSAPATRSTAPTAAPRATPAPAVARTPVQPPPRPAPLAVGGEQSGPTAPATAPVATLPTQPVFAPAPIDPDRGVVTAVREVKVAGQAQGLGAIGGAVVGGVIGNQVGNGSGRDAARILGAIGGAVAGHQIERQARASVRYDIDVRMDDGSLRTVSMSSAPDLRAGDTVRVEGNSLRLADGRALQPRPQSQPGVRYVAGEPAGA